VSNLIAGVGYIVVLDVAWDNSYPTGGETWDVSAYGTTVLGAWVIASTLDDGGYVNRYVCAAAGAAATGILQSYWGNNDGGADGPLIQTANTTDVSAQTAERWAVLFAA
jgi:hypothetical protein